jgi:predicted alpha/beta-fold hydrolase
MSGTELTRDSSNSARTGNGPVANDFVPRRFLRGGHLQTIAGNFLRRVNGLPEAEERLFEIEPGVQLLCHCNWQPEPRRKLTLLIVHGLEGSSRSRYVIGTGSRAWRAGWNVVRMNIRGCGGTEHLAATLYHSGLSQDVQKLVAAMAGDGLERIALVGFSMGGNQVLRAAGRWGREPPAQVVAAAAISPSCDLALCADRIHAPSNALYEWWFVQSLRRSFRRKSAQWPGKFDTTLLEHVRSVRDFDEHITSRYMGFAGADDYYDKASSKHALERIAIPTLVIHADDDPFIVISEESQRKLEANPNITFLHTRQGGHCAFLAAPAADGSDDGHWAERKIVEFLAHVESPRSR